MTVETLSDPNWSGQLLPSVDSKEVVRGEKDKSGTATFDAVPAPLGVARSQTK